MSLATSLLTPEEVQFLGDCIEPIIVLEVPATAETLIQRGLLVSAEVSRDQLSCHGLAVTERGRSYVTAWVGRQERPPRQTGTEGRLLEFTAVGRAPRL